MRPALFISFILLASSLLAQTASDLYYDGRDAEKKKQISRAYLLYSQAAALDPTNKEYWARALALRTRAVMESKVSPLAGTQETTNVIADEPEVPSVISTEELAEVEKFRPPTELIVKKGRFDFALRGEPRALYEQVSKICDLQVVFDGDFPPSAAPVPFRLGTMTCREAMRALDAATGSFTVPIGERIFLAAKDTPQKRTEIEPTVVLTMSIPEPVSVQEAQELARAVQQAMEIPKFSVDSQRRIVLMRDRLSKVYAAQALFQQLLYGKAQVVVEVEFLEVSKSSSYSWGLNLQTKFPIAYLGGAFGSKASAISGFANLVTFGGGKTLFGFGLANAELFASMSKNNSRSLMRTSMRSVDGLPATIHIGDKYPIITAEYSGGSGSNVGYVPPPSFTFEDLGLIIKVTPKVHSGGEVTLALESEFKVLTGNAANGIPIISNRKLSSTVRVSDGQWVIVAGLMNVNDARTISGLAGIGNIPLVGPLLRSNTRDKTNSQILLVIRPSVVTLPPDELVKPRSLWLGTDSRPLSTL